ncbi:MAG: hypothetical protein GVY36_03220 [Verrucomicrobia bacterium]|nr:hypothetical protein [Verrucomicrobiota bacterium]
MRMKATHSDNRARPGFIACGVLVAASGLHAVNVNFDNAEYVAGPGDTVAITLSFDEAVPNGLAGYHLRLNAASSGVFEPSASSISIVTELDNNLFGDGPADRTLADDSAKVLGFAEAGSPYTGVEFVTFDLKIDADAPAGTYALSLELPLEDSFVDGNFQIIDDDLVFDTSSLVIEVPPPASSAAPQYDGDADTFSLSFSGVPGRSYLLEVSDDLENWDDLTTLTAAPSGSMTYVDTSVSSHPKRFYRLVD